MAEIAPTEPNRLLYLVDAILSTNDPTKIERGFGRLQEMTPEQIQETMAQLTTTGISSLTNWLKTRPSNIRKLLPLITKVYSDDAIVDKLIDTAMMIGDEEYDAEGDFYYNPGGDNDGH